MKQSKLTWPDVTVQQFLDIYRLSINTDLDEMGKLERAVCILFDKTEKEVDEMQMGEFTRLSAQCAFVLNEEVPGKAHRQIRVGRNRYAVVYNPAKLKHRQYVEVLTFGEKPIDNMHMIMASIVNPVTWYGKHLQNSADDHEAIATDLLQARVIDIYHSAVFFCKLYVNSIYNIQDYLVQEMMSQQNRTKAQAQMIVTGLIDAMAGFIPPKNFRILKV